MTRDDTNWREVMAELLAARENEARTFLAYENAQTNFTDPKPERKAHERAMLRASAAEKAARELLAATSATQPQSLLRQPVRSIAEVSAQIPGGCHCPPDRCGAPVIMGMQAPCLRRKELA
jgi:hypothetical protein